MNTVSPPLPAMRADPAYALPEDVAQALYLISNILSINEDPGIQPGDLQGMSQVLAHAEHTWSKLRAACPEC
jgi:hypothetical protein